MAHPHRGHSPHPGRLNANQPLITPKIPPGWNPATEHSYSFREWLVDVRLWQDTTEIAERQQGPLVVLHLGGLANQIGKSMRPEQLRDGGVFDLGDGRGAVQQTGLNLLIALLRARFADLTIETSLRAMDVFDSFNRQPQERIDEALTRFELLRQKASVCLLYTSDAADE